MKAKKMFLKREEGESITDFVNREHQHSRRAMAMEARITRQMTRQFSQENQILMEKIHVENQALWERMQVELHGIRNSLVSIDGKLDKLNDIDQKLDGVDRKLDRIDGKLESMDGKLESMDGKLESMDGKLESMDGKLESMDGKLESIDRKLEPGSNGRRHNGAEPDSG